MTWFYGLSLAVAAIQVPAPSPLPSPIAQTPSATSPLSASPKLEVLGSKLKDKVLGLQDVLSISLAENPALARAGETLLRSRGRLNEARSGFEPTLSLSPGLQYIGRSVTNASTIQATLPLDISHLLASATQQAHFEEIAARLNINRTRNDLVYETTSAFYAALRSQALKKVAEENVTNSQTRLDDAEVRYHARAVEYLDVVRAQTDVADAQKTVLQAQGNEDLALARLARAMGVEVTAPLKIDDSGAVTYPAGEENLKPIEIPTPDQQIVPPAVQPNLATGDVAAVHLEASGSDLGSEYQNVLNEALKTRPELFQADADLAAARKGVALARKSEDPSFVVGFGYYDLRTQSGSKVNEPQAYVGINIPIYDGGLAKARAQEAKADVSAAITDRREESDAISLEVQQAYISYNLAQNLVHVSGQALLQARLAYQLAQVRYRTGVSAKAGISPLIELSDAQTALTLAEENRVNALYDYNDARVRLNKAIGRYSYSDGTTGFQSPPGPKTVGR